MTQLAFLGTGTMGLPMARNLLRAGVTVHAWNRTLDRAKPLADDGSELFEYAAAAADGCPTDDHDAVRSAGRRPPGLLRRGRGRSARPRLRQAEGPGDDEARLRRR